jgi:hypothetical protein
LFHSDQEISNIKDIQFGYQLSDKNTVLQSSQFPPGKIVYECADRTPVQTVILNIENSTEYDLIVWVMTSQGNRSEDTLKLAKMLPPKPYPSWTWNGEEWEAPVPKKYDQPYQWNETTLQWDYDPTTPSVFPGYEVT